MKTSRYYSGAIMLLIAGLFAGCNKYPEGPDFSLRTKKARVVNDWKIDYAFDLKDQDVITDRFTGETWEFTRRGEWIERENGYVDDGGTWDFVGQKENLVITVDESSTYFEVLKLEEESMWIRNSDEEIHFTPR